MEKEDKIKLQKAIEKSLGEQWEVKPITVPKVNGPRDGLQCRHEGDSHALVIYPDDYAGMLAPGDRMADVGRYAAGLVEENRTALPEITDLPSAEDFRKGLFIQLVNADANRALLENTVYDSVEDMAAVVRCKVAEEGALLYSFRVTKDSLPLFRMGQSEVLAEAYKNTAAQEFQLRNTADILREELERQIEAGEVTEIQREVLEEMLAQESPLYVLTNQEKVNGANVMLCPEALQKVSEELGEPYYILPSSIHEVMVVRESEDMDIGKMKEMVKEMNLSTVEPEDLLSYEVFRYDGRKLSVAREDVQKVSETVDRVKHHKWTI